MSLQESGVWKYMEKAWAGCNEVCKQTMTPEFENTSLA